MGEEEENLRALEALLTEFFSPATDNSRKAAIEKVPHTCLVLLHTGHCRC